MTKYILVKKTMRKDINVEIVRKIITNEFKYVDNLCFAGSSGEYLELLSSKSDADLMRVVYRQVRSAHVVAPEIVSIFAQNTFS